MDQSLRDTIRALVVERQRREPWPDGRVATTLGISCGYWRPIRTEIKPLTWLVVMCVLQQFPEYTPTVLSSLCLTKSVSSRKQKCIKKGHSTYGYKQQ